MCSSDLIFIRQVTRPLVRLSEAAHSLAEERGVRLEPPEDRELAELVRAFNHMSARLEERRAENQRLAAQIQRGVVPARSITELEGFVAKESWANAGFATPEATFQSFLWSLREGNVRQVAECLRPEERDEIAERDVGGRERGRGGREGLPAELTPHERREELHHDARGHSLDHQRSEERREGKECRSLWSPYQ